MRKLPLLAIAVAAAFAPYALAQPQASGAVGVAPGKAAAAQTVKASATVESVDKATRTVTRKLADGRTRSVVAGDEVRNFDQIKPGDKLTIQYVEALTIELKKDGKAVLGRQEAGGMQRNPAGDKPGGVALREVTAVADVVNVDAKKQLVQVKNDKGKVIDLNVRDPEQLKLIKKGDQVQATYTEAIAVSMEPAAAPKK